MRCSTRAGLWPAVEAGSSGGWPHGGEIDIMDYYRGTLLANVTSGGHPSATAFPGQLEVDYIRVYQKAR